MATSTTPFCDAFAGTVVTRLVVGSTVVGAEEAGQLFLVHPPQMPASCVVHVTLGAVHDIDGANPAQFSRRYRSYCKTGYVHDTLVDTPPVKLFDPRTCVLHPGRAAQMPKGYPQLGPGWYL